jgi:general secretion pathway protein G
MRWLRSARGFTFIELVIVVAVMMVIASAAMPLARVSIKRQREAELHRALREMRTAIDKYKDAADRNVIAPGQFGSENYPTDLQTLVDGVPFMNDQTGRKFKVLRQILPDPITGKVEWGLRSYQDDPKSMTWGGQNIYNVYSKAEGKALDGTLYKDW